MTRARRRLAKIVLGMGAIAGLALAGWVGLLAFPQLLCPKHVRVGPVSLYFDEIPPAEAEGLARRVARRLEGSGLCDSADNLRAFLFQSAAKYGLMTRLAAVPRDAQGFNLSVLGHTYVSAPRVAELGMRSGGVPRYSVWEGDLAHTIAHELAHQILADRMGRRGLPQWKREGLAEYVANIGLIRGDPAASLPARLAMYRDSRTWSATRGWERHGWDRIHYESGLLVEYLIDVRGLSPEEIAADGVTLEATRAALREWAELGPRHDRLDP